ncbi:MAG: low molecular weight protein-tyrosine phosphatase [Pseudonocardiales bacterium]|jgi:protein-tyrosine phosphatase|nr:low molecular weight protein-tyrosine phosphatase [Pseudonocardiales bacterium]
MLPDREPAGGPVRICFVCSGNICRSPTAEVVLRAKLADAGWADEMILDSAGTGPWHAGKDMDPRAREALCRHGYRPPPHIARQFLAEDFASRHLVIALDGGHVARLGQLARLAADPADAAASISLLRSYDPAAVATGELDVPDPYYDGEAEFEAALAQIEAACDGLAQALQWQFSGNSTASCRKTD